MAKKGANLFNSVQVKKWKMSSHDLSHNVKMSLKMGKLYPTVVMEALPGDIFGISCESLLRFAPMLAPVMHLMNVYMHYFFVPNRIVWPGWEDYISPPEDDTVPAVHPFIQPTAVNLPNNGLRTLWDYMGLPPSPGGGNACKVSAIPFAAYQKIYNEYYRDQNLIAPVVDSCVNGNNAANLDALLTMRIRAWEHDYFTSCLPFAQKGEPVDIPLGEVELNPTLGITNIIRKTSDHTILVGNNWPLQDEAGGLIVQDPGGPTDTEVVIDPNTAWQVQATSINDLRLAYKLQEYLETNARAGTRYNESILAQFGVRTSDKRLQRPEYITGIKTPVMISEVLNTTGGEADPQGTMAGHGVAVTTGNYGNFRTEEHGYIIGIMSVMPKPAYQQGVHRTWLRLNDKTEYAFPVFGNLGEQEVFNKEIYAWQGAADDQVFGYNPRHAEYKFMGDRVAGDFRSTLAFWHLGRIFTAAPALNQAFIECVPSDRIFAVQGENAPDNLWCQIYHKIHAVRKLPKYGTPQNY